MRNFSTTSAGTNFTVADKISVWNKAKVVFGRDPSLIRQDCYGALISWSEYGNTTPNGLGWEIDHIIPVVRLGTDMINNLQPLQWQNNRHKSDSWPPPTSGVVRAV